MQGMVMASGDQQPIDGIATIGQLWGILWTSYMIPTVQDLFSASWCLDDIDEREKNLS